MEVVTVEEQPVVVEERVTLELVIMVYIPDVLWLEAEEVLGYAEGYDSAKAGYGGGASGGNGDGYSSDRFGYGGTQSKAGANATLGGTMTTGGFGIGGGGTSDYVSGGGGGWFGGGCGNNAGKGGGGSGYVLTDSSYKPTGYLLGSEYYLSNAQTIGGNQSFPSPGGGNETGHSGNGYARITLVE